MLLNEDLDGGAVPGVLVILAGDVTTVNVRVIELLTVVNRSRRR
jgi:hypothetical protein